MSGASRSTNTLTNEKEMMLKMAWQSDALQGIFSLPTPSVGGKIKVVLALKGRSRKGARTKHTRTASSGHPVKVKAESRLPS